MSSWTPDELEHVAGAIADVSGRAADDPLVARAAARALEDIPREDVLDLDDAHVPGVATHVPHESVPVAGASASDSTEVAALIAILEADSSPSAEAGRRRVTYVRQWAEDQGISTGQLKTAVEAQDANGYERFTSAAAIRVVQSLAG